MEWINWEIDIPETDSFIYYMISSDHPDIKAGWCACIDNMIMVYDACDPDGVAIIPKYWNLINNPIENNWIKWLEKEPKAGNYVWIRDTKQQIDNYELAWTVGREGTIKCILPADPTMSKHIEEEWQYIN